MAHPTYEDYALPSAGGAISRFAYARAKTAGVAVLPLLRRAHLTTEEIENESARLTVRDQIEFLNLVADALSDDLLGFHLALVPDLREFGLLYYVSASAETMGDAFKRFVRYSTILNEGIVANCTQNDAISLLLRYVGVNRHPDRHQMEFYFVGVMRICRQITGRRIIPLHVRFVHLRPKSTKEITEFFGVEPEFGADRDELVFSAKVGSLPIISADPYLNKLLLTFCEEAIAKRSQYRGSLRSNVENAIVTLLPHGMARADEIARRLGVGLRTLSRRLAVEGYTFSEVLENLRFDLANRYLTDRHLSISQIAWLLGYQEVGNFCHAYKRWSGRTPSESRVFLQDQVRGFRDPFESQAAPRATDR